MAGLLRIQFSIQFSRAIFLAAAILLAAIAAGHAQTPEQVFALGASSHPISAWIVVPIALMAMTALIVLCARFIRNNPATDAEMRGEAGDRPITPIPGSDGHIHFH